MHIVLSEKRKCPRCKKFFMGSAEEIYDLVICSECYEDFKHELEPFLKIDIYNYFQPERLNPETPKGDAIV